MACARPAKIVTALKLTCRNDEVMNSDENKEMVIGREFSISRPWSLVREISRNLLVTKGLKPKPANNKWYYSALVAQLALILLSLSSRWIIFSCKIDPIWKNTGNT